MPSSNKAKRKAVPPSGEREKMDDGSPEKLLANAFHTDLDINVLEEDDDAYKMEQSILFHIADEFMSDGKTWRNHSYLYYFNRDKRDFVIKYMEYLENALATLRSKYFAENLIIAYSVIEKSNLVQGIKGRLLNDLKWHVSQQFPQVEDPLQEAREHREYVDSKGQEDEKDISDEPKPDRSGKRVTEERGNLKRLSVSFPSDLAQEIQSRSDATGATLSKVIVDLVGERVRFESGERDSVMLNLPPTLSPDLRRSVEAMAQTIRDLVDDHDDPEP